MATIEKYRNQVQKFAEFFFFFPHFWQLKPTVCKYVVFDISLSVYLFIYLFIYLLGQDILAFQIFITLRFGYTKTFKTYEGRVWAPSYHISLCEVKNGFFF
jgi:hypothetical protein